MTAMYTRIFSENTKVCFFLVEILLKHHNIFDGYPNDVDDVDEAHLDAAPIWQPRKAEVPSEQSQFGSGSRFGLKAGQGGVKLTAEREGFRLKS